MNLSPEIQEEVEAAIRSLLKSKWNVAKIAKQLSSPDSYGKQGVTLAGCTELASSLCKLMNDGIRADNRELTRLIRESAARHGVPLGYRRSR